MGEDAEEDGEHQEEDQHKEEEQEDQEDQEDEEDESKDEDEDDEDEQATGINQVLFHFFSITSPIISHLNTKLTFRI